MMMTSLLPMHSLGHGFIPPPIRAADREWIDQIIFGEPT